MYKKLVMIDYIMVSHLAEYFKMERNVHDIPSKYVFSTAIRVRWGLDDNCDNFFIFSTKLYVPTLIKTASAGQFYLVFSIP